MLGSSRDALALCGGALEQLSGDVNRAQIGSELFSIAALLDSENVLRSALADSGQGVEVRENLAAEVFGTRVGTVSAELLMTAVTQRWSEDVDLVLALEELAAQAILTAAQNENTLDATEEEIFLFGRQCSAPEPKNLSRSPLPAATVSNTLAPDLRSSYFVFGLACSSQKEQIRRGWIEPGCSAVALKKVWV